MSWMRAAMELQQEREEEVFDEDGDEMSLVQKDWKRSMEKRLKEGYLDGMDAGKENSLQTGFNLGYKLGASMLMPCGELRGTISAFVTWCQVQKLDPTMNARLGGLLAAVCQCEEQIVKGLTSIHQVVHPSELSNSMDDMGLNSHAQNSSDGSCAASQNCCQKQECRSSSFVNCRTTQELESAMKRELGRILKDTHSVAQELNMSSDLLYYLQTLETKYLLI
ncbi:protein YAE1 homolog [Pyxicephalus adspersus]|uniref:Essential protein Yae1 N-terminal domain-containing protein n=1 Tax=Pyxicephalus adspersus TaxID=30357 RepID=A0AAV3AAX8_PYXAD|nr:TPA: hypothetical protein GDO54_012412 [Pyxicephalus adspersus]